MIMPYPYLTWETTIRQTEIGFYVTLCLITIGRKGLNEWEISFHFGKQKPWKK